MAKLTRDRDIIIKFQPKIQKIISLNRTGLQGAQGPIGPQGEQGIQGIQGLVGPEGPQGLRGFTGDKGERGFTGADSVVPGPKGDKGETGAKGDTGLQGIQGEHGSDAEVTQETILNAVYNTNFFSENFNVLSKDAQNLTPNEKNELRQNIGADSGNNVYYTVNGVIAKSITERNTESVWVLDFVETQNERTAILNGSNTSDQTNAINNALINASIRGVAVELSGGKWRISTPIVLNYNGARVFGAGPAVTTIEVIGATTKGIQTSDNINNWSIDNLKITRSTTGTSGGVGLDLSNVNSRGRIQNVWVKGHFNGVALGPTDYSEMVNCIIEQSVGDNIIMKNLSTDGTCQWSVSRVLSQFCGGRAFAFDAVAGPSQCIVGEVSGLLTFASTGHGFAINGLPGLPVQDVRLQSSFIGGAGDSNIFLNTYGKLHQINDCFIELAGQDKTGVTYETLPSNVGSGIEITANNDDVVVNGSRIDANSHCGIRCEGGILVLNGTRLLNNGLALAAGLRAGVRMFNAAKLFSSNVTSTNTGGNTSQQLGIYMYIGSGCSIVGGSVSGNSAINIGAEIDFHLCAVVGVEGGPTITPLVGTLGASYADDAAAAAGGVVLNQEYRNGSVKMIRVT